MSELEYNERKDINMGWTYDNTQVVPPVVKYKGICRNHAKHKFCAYWVAKQSKENKQKILGYRCTLFDKDKTGYDALPVCNRKYGQSYDGPPIA